jgi:hypothetical protein
MNIFILVEGRTEKKIYPKWLAQLVPHLSKVDRPALVNRNNYCIISSDGYYSLFNYLEEIIDEINDIGTFDYFVIVVDTDDKRVDEREFEIRDFIIKKGIKFSQSTDFVIILQRCCFETWLLGNRQIFKENAQDDVLKSWIKHFNVSINDPEMMTLPLDYAGSIGNFHKIYAEKMQIEYYKNRDAESITDLNHLTAIIERFEQTGHLATFGNFLNFCKKINQSSN